MGRLPPELVELVVSCFPLIPGPGYHPRTSSMQHVAVTIGKCGLVCREWLPSSRRALFRRIRITQYNSSELMSLVKPPKLATFLHFIREMDFVDTGSSIEQMDRWFPPAFLQIMAIMPSPPLLRWVRFRTPHLYGPILGQLDQHAIFQGITTLRLALKNGPRLSDLATAIASFPALKALHLSLYNDWADRTIPDADCKLPPTFHSLSLEWKYMAPFVAWMRNSRPSISNLKISFDSTVYREKESQLPAAEFISSLQGVLTSLTLRFCDTMPKAQQGVWDAFLKRNPNVREFSFRGPRAQAALLLQRLYNPAALMLKKMVMIVALEVERCALVNTNIDPDWCGLDALLAPLAIELLQMSFTPTMHFRPNPHQSRYDVDRVRGEIPERLPLCSARGLITVVDFDDSMWDED